MNTGTPNKEQLPIRSILLADDDSDDQFFFREALSEIDHSVQLDVAKDGEELMEQLRHKVPGIIFLNLNLPGKNGYQCLKEIKGDPRLQFSVVVILGPFRTPCKKKTAHQLGVDLIFIKPFNYTDLKSELKDLLTLNWRDTVKPNQMNFHTEIRSFPSGRSKCSN